jgi:DNA-binding transcriptional LysR family regulator
MRAPRRAGQLEITHAGQLVADYARAVLVDYDTLKSDLDDIRGVQRRLLKLAVVESVAHYGPISALAKFREGFPAVSFDVRLMPAPQIVDAVCQGQYDIGVAFCAEPAQDIITLGSVAEPIVFVVRADHRRWTSVHGGNRGNVLMRVMAKGIYSNEETEIWATSLCSLQLQTFGSEG